MHTVQQKDKTGLESSVTTLFGNFTEVTCRSLKTLGALSSESLLISSENHLHPAAPLFNIIILLNEAFSGYKHICGFHSISQDF